MLREASYPAVQYIPRKDVDMSLLEWTDHATYCRYKGRLNRSLAVVEPVSGSRKRKSEKREQRLAPEKIAV
jgi:Domain of unknown function (DUF427)